METKRYKYPRTPHLSFSPGVGEDDIKLNSSEIFSDRHVIVTEKLDGENTTLYPDYIHARSLDSRHHPSRAWVKALQASIAGDIPRGWRICGENLYARHSIIYNELKSYFYMFSIWNEENYCLSWPETQEWASLLGLQLPQVFYEGIWNTAKISSLAQHLDLDKCEGYVVRSAAAFHFHDFANHVAKWVRSHHVQTEDHWMYQEVVPNKLSNR